MRVRHIEDGVVHFAKARGKHRSFGHLLCQPDKRVATFSPEYTGWEESNASVTCPDCLSLTGGRAEPRTERKRRAGRKGMSKDCPFVDYDQKAQPEIVTGPAKQSGMGRIKTNGWIHMTKGTFGRRVTAKESRQRIKSELKEWDD